MADPRASATDRKEGTAMNNPGQPVNEKSALRAKQPHLALLCASFFLSTVASAESVTVDGRDFMPLNAAGQALYAESGAGNLICTGPNGSHLFIAQVPLPPAPLVLDLKQMALWGGDFSAADADVRLSRYCQSDFVASSPVRTIISERGSSGNGGNYFNAESLNFRVQDQRTCVYMLELTLGTDGCSGGGNLSLAKVRVRFDVLSDPIFSNGFEN
jgi:hypothetical protein